MDRCESCGNEYDSLFEVVMHGTRHTFDSFECAIHRLAPVCAACGTRVVGHGVQVDGTVYCCASCTRMADASAEIQDRVGSA